MNTEKQILRQKFRLQRSQLLPEVRKQKDHQLFLNLIQEPEILTADLILAYASCHNEPDTWEFIRWTLEKKIPIAFPKCGQNWHMQFFLINQLEDLQAGAHDLPEPITNRKAIITKNTICIVPGIAFTKEGIRLGQGGGYYDRFLKNYPELQTIGIGYDFMIKENLPYEEHDCRMKKIITDLTED